eukprot:403336184
MIYKPSFNLDDKLWKNIDYPLIKTWIEQKQQKKQEWIMLVQFDIQKASDYNEKKIKKVFDKVKLQFTKEQQLKIVKYIYNTDPNVDVPQILKADEQMCLKSFQQLLVQNIGLNIDEKINFYESQILYQQMKAKNNPNDFYQYLVLVFGKVFLLIRIGKLRVAFEQLQNLADVLQDKQRLFIDYDLDTNMKEMLRNDKIRGIQELCKLRLFDWNYHKIVDALLQQNKVVFIRVYYMYFWVVYTMLRSITMKPQDLLLDLYLQQLILQVLTSEIIVKEEY